jgi:hypothetical protein
MCFFPPYQCVLISISPYNVYFTQVTHFTHFTHAQLYNHYITCKPIEQPRTASLRCSRRTTDWPQTCRYLTLYFYTIMCIEPTISILLCVLIPPPPIMCI